MLGWLARIALLRVLPRRLLPVLTAVELFRLVRSMRARSSTSDRGSASDRRG